MGRNFQEMLAEQWNKGKFVSVGLDPEIDKIPKAMQVWDDKGLNAEGTILAFNKEIVKATADIACIYKLNLAFYLRHGCEGLRILQETITYINAIAPDVPTVVDGKFADIGNSSKGYANFVFDVLEADGATVNPYMGPDALEPFLSKPEKGIFIICHTSNPGATDLQEAHVANHWKPLYQVLARRVACKENSWNALGNCGLVMGATYPKQLAEVREIACKVPLLIPGIGAQGGDLEASVRAGIDSNKQGIIVNGSRGILYASQGDDFAQAARAETQRLTDLINEYRGA